MIRKSLLMGLSLLLSLFFTAVTHAQTRVLVGPSGTQAFDNSSIGVTVGLEVPFAKHYELNLQDTFSPLESHAALGGGRANITSASGIVWFSKRWGIIGGVEDSMYDVTKVTKDADYASGGAIYRGSVGGFPTRFVFKYIRQFNNGVTPSGLESSHLQGFDFGYTMRFGCVGAVCVRTSEDFVAGAVKTQGNPVCDGSYGITLPSCVRSTALGGGVTASVSIEFPRHRGHEFDVF